MQVARCLHSAILLADGRVLVAGGDSAANVWSSAEIYNPATKRWSMTGHMNSTRFDTAIVMLSNGKLLAPAGAAVNTIPRDSDDLYDPATGTWTPAPSLNLSRYAHSTVALADGVALVVGGFTQNSQNTNTSDSTTRQQRLDIHRFDDASGTRYDAARRRHRSRNAGLRTLYAGDGEVGADEGRYENSPHQRQLHAP